MPSSAVESLTQAELAYLAGIVDADGCIYVQKARNKNKNGKTTICYSANLIITTCDDSLVTWIRQRLPVRISITKPRKSTHSGSYNIYWRTRSAIELLKKTIPYMVVKKDRAMILVNEWKDFVKVPMLRESIYNRIHTINQTVKTLKRGE